MSRTERFIHDESGVALVFAMLAVIILGGLAVLFVSRAYTENRATFSEQRYETTIHTAEAGVDDLIKTLNRDFDFVTTEPPAGGGDDHVFVDSTNSSLVGASEAAQRQWAVDIAMDPDRCTVVSTVVGEACAIRPRLDSATGPLADFIFGVGFSPDRAEADKIRVVKLGIELGVFIPAQAILTQGDLDPLNITICGEDRDVHSNSSIKVQGSADTVTPGTKSDTCPQDASGKVTSFGTFTKTGLPDIDPDSGQTGQEIDVPSVSAAEVYEMFLHPSGREYTDENPSDGVSDHAVDENGDWVWFNLCPDGTVRAPFFPTGYDPAQDDPNPCHADNTEILFPTVPPEPDFNGWKPPNNATAPWSAGGGNNNNQSPLTGGIYYVYERNAQISGSLGNNVKLTLLTDAKGHIEPFERHAQPSNFNGLPGPTRTCALNGKNDGNISIQGVGGGDFNPFLKSQLLLADRDISMGGQISSAVRGIIAAHEQTGLGGTPSIAGAVIAEDACRDSAQSPESKNSISGNFHIDHSFPNVSTLPSVVHITAWNEY